MDPRGFNKGRLSAILRRTPASTGGRIASAGECIGYSPHTRQKLNTGDQFHQTPGTIFIQHCPRRVPLACSTYEVEVTALGPTEYSMVVVAGQCESCASLVDKRLEEARNLKVNLRVCHLYFNWPCCLRMGRGGATSSIQENDMPYTPWHLSSHLRPIRPGTYRPIF